MGTNVSTTYVTCPADPSKTLGIKLPFLVMIIKNLKKRITYFLRILLSLLSPEENIVAWFDKFVVMRHG